MTNGKKYKTTKERVEAFRAFCDKHNCHDCPLGKTNGLEECCFNWFDLKFEERLEPCPFCGSEARLISGFEDNYVICRNDDCASAIVARSFSSADEAIAAWNRRVK